MDGVDKTKQIYGWWLNVDVEIHCPCGSYIQISDGETTIKRCSNCGQWWVLSITANMLEEGPNERNDIG